MLVSKVDFSLVYHHRSLLIIKDCFILDDLRVRLSDDCNNEVHEDHKDKERADQVDYKSVGHQSARVSVLQITFKFRVVDYIKALVRVYE